MSQFKTTYNILTKVDYDELFDANKFNYNFDVLPPKVDWDYSRELRIEDIDIWEVLYESSEGIGVYASWLPYAEYYMITTGFRPGGTNIPENKDIETFYGAGAQQRVFKRAKELGIPLGVYKTWIDDKDLWLYNNAN